MEELIEEVITEEVIETPEVLDMPEEEPVLDPEEVITEDFGVICKQDGEVTAYGFWTGTRANVQRLEEWAEFGYEKTSDKYVQGYDGKWYVEGTEPEKPAPTYEEVKEARANAYANEVDPLMSQYSRKKTFNLFEGNEEAELLAKIEAKVAEIKARYPYPSEPIEEIDELPVVEESSLDEVVVSKMETVDIVD